MDHKEKLGALFSGAGKTARGLLDRAIQSADQNEDGKFDLSDISLLAQAVESSVREGTQSIRTTADEKARELERRSLRPIFPDTLDSSDFFMPKFIRVIQRDRRRSESAVCQGSIGYLSDQKGLHIVNVFRDSVEQFGLQFYPDCDSEFFYVDPSSRDCYLSLDEYFSYLKIARINELQTIAQDLGARHFRVTYKEEQTSFSDKKVTAEADVQALAQASGSHSASSKKYSTVEIAAEMTFPGHSPVRPNLRYLQRDPSIQTLVTMRMNPDTPLLHQKYILNLSRSSGMKESDAVKIDAVLKGLKCSGNSTVAGEVQNEARRYLEYDIEF